MVSYGERPKLLRIENRKLVCHFWFVGWDQISLGINICFRSPNIEIHLPFGFIKIGWSGTAIYKK